MERPMAPDERDRSFDKALMRHLRSAAHAGEAVSTPAVPGSQAGACPDSETLAAYHERSLFPAQLNSLKEHIVGCAQCLAILSQLEATDEISLQAAGREEAVTRRPLHRHHPFQPSRRRSLPRRKPLPRCRNPRPMNLPAPMREARQAL